MIAVQIDLLDARHLGHLARQLGQLILREVEELDVRELENLDRRRKQLLLTQAKNVRLEAVLEPEGIGYDGFGAVADGAELSRKRRLLRHDLVALDARLRGDLVVLHRNVRLADRPLLLDLLERHHRVVH